ncbi:MAG: YkgJ family cysteine cluster protein [Casimicrobium sp.]
MSNKVRYDCSECPGYCCSYDYIETKPSDVKRLAKHHGIEVDVAREKFTKEVEHEGETIRVLRHRKDHVYKSMCMFFDQDDRRCTIYEGRPQVCRDYPNGNTCGYYSFIKFERKHQGDETFIPSA